MILCCFQTTADDTITVTISIIDQPAQFEKGVPKIIAGLWHTVTFEHIDTINQELLLTLYKGTTYPYQNNETNFYQWNYDPTTTNPWQKTTSYGNETINQELCGTHSNKVTFCIGVPDTLPNQIFYNELWTLTISTPEKELYKNEIYLEKPTRGFAKSHGDRLSFSVDPFTEMITEASDYLILKNTGNVPLNITLDFKLLNRLITYTESSKQISAFEKQNFKLELNAPSWKPQRIQQAGTASAVVSAHYLLDEEASGTAISLQTALVIDVPTLNVFVGHNNFQLTTLNSSTGFSFQYQKSLSMNEGEIKTINSYLSGKGTATVTIEANDNVTILEINRNELPVTSPITVISTDNEEQFISIKLKALSENRNGKLTYTIEHEKNVETFTTIISVGPPDSDDQPTAIGATSPVILIVLFSLIVAAGYMLYTYLIHGRGN